MRPDPAPAHPDTPAVADPAADWARLDPRAHLPADLAARVARFWGGAGADDDHRPDGRARALRPPVGA